MQQPSWPERATNALFEAKTTAAMRGEAFTSRNVLEILSRFHDELVKELAPRAQQKEKDPRHHAITSRWGALYEEAFGCAYSFSVKDATTLKKFLPTVKITADEFLEIASAAWHRGREDRFARCCKAAVTLHGLCQFYNDIRVELKTESGTAPKGRAGFA